MLDQLRQRAGGWAARILIGLLVISFAVWGVSDMFGNSNINIVGSVGTQNVATADFQTAYQNAMRSVSQNEGRNITPAEAVAMGVPQEVLGSMMAQAALDDQVTKLGLGISSQTVADIIGRDPEFQLDGAFSASRYSQVLAMVGYTATRYENEIRSSILRNHIGEAVTGGLALPNATKTAIRDYRNEQRRIAYFTIDPGAVDPAGQPTEEELAAYYEDNKLLWRVPETRQLAVMALDSATLSDPANVTEDEALAYYNRHIAEYSTPEKRQVLQMVFPTSARADAVQAMLDAGRSYDELVAAGEITPVDIGTLARSEFLQPAVGTEAFRLEAGGTSIITGTSGRILVHVGEVVPGFTVPFEVVRDIAVRGAASDAAAADIASLREQIEDERSANVTVPAVADQFGLPVVEIPAVTATGTDADGNPILNLPGGQQLVDAAFEADIDFAPLPVRLSATSYVWFDVVNIIAAHDRPLDEVRDQVIAAWQDYDIGNRLSLLASSLADRIRAGETVEAVAAELNLPVSIVTFSRETASTSGLTSAAVAIAFRGPAGTTTTAATADGKGYVVMDVAEVILATEDTEAVLTDLNDLTTSVLDDIVRAYVLDVQQRTNFSINQAAYNAVVGASATQ